MIGNSEELDVPHGCRDGLRSQLTSVSLRDLWVKEFGPPALP
jgi:hypothetical protein